MKKKFQTNWDRGVFLNLEGVEKLQNNKQINKQKGLPDDVGSNYIR